MAPKADLVFESRTTFAHANRQRDRLRWLAAKVQPLRSVVACDVVSCAPCAGSQRSDPVAMAHTPGPISHNRRYAGIDAINAASAGGTPGLGLRLTNPATTYQMSNHRGMEASTAERTSTLGDVRAFKSRGC